MIASPPSVRRLVVPLLVAALAVAGCGDDSGESTGTTTTTTTIADETDPGAEPDPPDATTTTTEPVVLTDSFRGVTSDAIKIGVTTVDLESLQGLVDLDHGSYGDAYRAIIDDVNAGGGVLGRRIDMVFEPFIPIGTVSSDEICARLVDDEQVFAVLGAMLGDAPLCYTELNDTALVGPGQTDARMARATAPWFSPMRNADDAARVIVNGVAEQGYFDGATVAVVAEATAQPQVESVVLPLLDDLGVTVVDVDYLEASLVDAAATIAEVGLMAERQQVEGADTILTIDGAGPRYAGGIEDLPYRPRILATSLGSLRGYIRDRGGRDLSVLAGSAAGNTNEQLGWWDDDVIQECIRIVEEATGTVILDPNTRGPEEPENIVSVAAACRQVRLFVAIAEAAGGDLTNESFAAAGQSLGDFHIPGLGLGHYDAENPDGNAPINLYEWDDSIQDLAATGVVLG
ncbi:MAG: ABC transporter substrate-binding protein [Acidimicrobiales bacterium]|nr:ABC transporter substrate-binding protein [Acidimicrobiales bacterium]